MPALRLAQIVAEAIVQVEPMARVSQCVVEAIMGYTTPSPSTPTGAGVSQCVAEVLYSDTGPHARVSQYVVEALFTAATIGEGGVPGGGSSTVSWGWGT